MPDEKLPRKLAAIFYADVVGYSRLSNKDEEATHRTLLEYLDLISIMVAKSNGRVLNFAGDAVLAEFNSVIEAVSCAIDTQHEIAIRNRGTSSNRRLQFRIGINLGDVIISRNEIYGDGVNVAARLEGLADTGGICISRKVLHEVRDKLEVGYQYLGEKEVKNISTPIPAYRLILDSSKAGQIVDESETGKEHAQAGKTAVSRNWKYVGASMTAFVVVVAILAYFLLFSPVDERDATLTVNANGKSEEVGASLKSDENINKTISEQPSIAVLPFDNLSNDPEQDYFSDGITEDLITDLAQISGLRVIARNSVFTYKGQAVKVQDVARELNVNHILEGSVRKVGDKIRFNVQLIDARTGNHIWAERFDRKLDDIFALQDEVCERIVASLKLKLSERERADVFKRYTNNVDAYELFLRGQREFFRFNRDGNREARNLYSKAAQIDPTFARAIANLGWTHARDFQDGWSQSPEQSLEVAFDLVNKAKSLDPSSSHVYWVLGQVLLYKREYEAAIQAVRKSIELSPSNPDPKILLARILAFSGNSRESVQLIEEATNTNPFYPMQYMMNLGIAYFVSGEYQKAEEALLKAIERNPDAQRVRMWLVATYANAGKKDEAQWEYEELLTLNPHFSISSIEKSIPFRSTAVRDKLVAGIQVAMQ